MVVHKLSSPFKWLAFFAARLDEAPYTMPSTSHHIGAILDHHEHSPEDVGGATQVGSQPPLAKFEMQAAVRFQKQQLDSLLKPIFEGRTIKHLPSGMYRSTPQASPTIEDFSSLVGARFYIDPYLPRDSQLKVRWLLLFGSRCLYD